VTGWVSAARSLKPKVFNIESCFHLNSINQAIKQFYSHIMAELAAIGLAGNIIQFVDFSIKLFRDGREIYRSAQGSKPEELELETVTEDFKSLSNQLHSSLQSTQPLKLDDSKLQKLAAECEKLANELLGILGNLKINDQHNRKWESFKQALKRVLKEKEIRGLERRLDRLREDISSRLQYMLRYVVPRDPSRKSFTEIRPEIHSQPS